MQDRYFKRLLMHVAAVLAAVAMWWVITDFAAALGASVLAFLLVTAIANLAYGPMPTAKDVRKDVEDILRRGDGA
jgi:hypothetical protein